MAKSFSNVVNLSSFISYAMVRRGYTAAASQVEAKVVRGGGALKKTEEKTTVESREKTTWAPDPKTGYYRPETGAKEVDAAELRALHLNEKH